MQLNKINNMKSLTLTALISVFLLSACSQSTKLDRSKMPEAGEAPEIKIADYKTFTLDNGMKVYVVKDKQSPMVTFTMEIDRNPIREGEKAGYVSLAGNMLGTATKNRSKDELNEAIDFIGADFSAFSTGFYASSLKQHHQKLVQLSADVIKNPEFKEEEFQKQKKQMLSSIQSNENSTTTTERSTSRSSGRYCFPGF